MGWPGYLKAKILIGFIWPITIATNMLTLTRILFFSLLRYAYRSSHLKRRVISEKEVSIQYLRGGILLGSIECVVS